MNRAKLAILILLTIGILDSIYLTIEHYNTNLLYCPNIAGFVSCSTVLGSSYSVILGIPLAVLSLVWTAIMMLLFLSYKNKVSSFIMPIWYILGFIGIAYSLTAQMLIGKICIYCDLLDVIILGSILLILFAKPFRQQKVL